MVYLVHRFFAFGDISGDALKLDKLSVFVLDPFYVDFQGNLFSV